MLELLACLSHDWSSFTLFECNHYYLYIYSIFL